MKWFQLLDGWFQDVPQETLEHSDPLEELPEEKVNAIVESVAKTITDKGMAYPASLFLEIGRPLSFYASQGLIFASPVLIPFFSEKKLNAASAFLGKRSNVAKLSERLVVLYDDELRERKMRRLNLTSGKG
jgi:hypothetical protein